MLFALALPAGASAGTALIEEGDIVFVADAGEVNQISVRTWSSNFSVTPYDDREQYFITDNATGATIAPGEGCVQGQNLTSGAPEPKTVVCPQAGVAAIFASLGDLADTWDSERTTPNLPAVVEASEGDDRLYGSDADDILDGGDGEDEIGGDAQDTPDAGGGDTILGGPGYDKLNGLNGDDQMDGGEGPDYISGGPGDDALFGGTSEDPDHLIGEAGDDELYGEGGDDNPLAPDGESLLLPGLNGGPGNDTVSGDDGNDELRGDTLATTFAGDDTDTVLGGDGQDATSYERRTNSVSITLDDVANDGEVDPADPNASVENDNITSDVEKVTGSEAADHMVGAGGEENLIGEEGNDEIEGRGGNDVLEGRDGDDHLFGEAGNDEISGRAGNDEIEGGDNDDQLQGGQSDDRITGGAGTDKFIGDGDLEGFDGPDAIFARDGNAETILCGGDVDDGDTGEADSNDIFSTTGPQACENLARPGPGTVGMNANTATFNATAGTVNQLTVTQDANYVYFQDAGGPVNPGPGCEAVTANRVRCPRNAAAALGPALNAVTLNLGDQNDTVTSTQTLPTQINGGDGADTLRGGAGPDVIDGGTGPDAMFGGGGTDRVTYASRGAVTADIDAVADDGNTGDGPAGARDNIRGDVEDLTGSPQGDTLTGGANDNTLDGGAGPDTMFGGSGADTVTYATRTAGVTVDIDAQADDGSSSDGPAGARDNVRGDVETLVGSAQGDTLTGGANNNTLEGGAGPDTMFGSSGTDTVTYASRQVGVTVDIDAQADDGSSSDGPAGARDNVRGDVENLTGSPRRDTLTGGGNHNTLDGGAGPDTMFGAGGTDTVTYATRSRRRDREHQRGRR